MYYEVMLDNGHYPMVYQCSTMHEAYGCLEELASWVPKIRVDLDLVMEQLVRMKNNKRGNFSAHGYQVTVREGEV